MDIIKSGIEATEGVVGTDRLKQIGTYLKNNVLEQSKDEQKGDR